MKSVLPRPIESTAAAQAKQVLVRRKVQVRGVVQGVGFRPHVFNLAESLGLAGYVLNSSAGVTVEVEGAAEQVERFVEGLREHPPVLAKIEQYTVEEVAATGEREFVIRESVPVPGEFVLVSPDVATCADCWSDFTDPKNRRYGYPFTNCTNCGPRYTIVQDIPYDRPLTTMALFAMCPECDAEYHDPRDRRFHAQPNACPVCGPQLVLIPAAEKDRELSFPTQGESLAVIREVRALLKQGKIIAIRGLGGYQLACDATNSLAVSELRRRKRRSDKPFGLMARDVESIRRVCELDAVAERELTSSRKPIVVLPRKDFSLVPAAVAPGNQTLGYMLPYTPLHALLFGEAQDAPSEFLALVMTSGNLSEEPIVTSNGEARERLSEIADHLLVHNREIHMRADDSVVRVYEGVARTIRRSRGFVPETVDVGRKMTELLAVGGELKNTFCLTKDRYAILSQHIGDMENQETLRFFEETLGNLKNVFKVEPKAVAHDLHPGYLSTRFAKEYAKEHGLPLIGVQHHHAHVVSCMAENHLSGDVLGIAFDGTGYGTDGKIWGGEFLVADETHFARYAHFRYVGLPGGDAAVKEPWRVALSYLEDSFGAFLLPERLPMLRELESKRRAVVQTMLRTGLNTAMTSSCGRLFDAAAAIAGFRSTVSYEGQAAIEFEAMADRGCTRWYPFEILPSQEEAVNEVDFRLTIAELTEDVLARVPRSIVAAKFHNTVARVMLECAIAMREATGLRRICLSGGTFQNWYLLERSMAWLRDEGFEVFTHAQVPANDGGLALGQALIANKRLEKGGAACV